MKSVLISIRPKWCELIASGEKTIEVRKTAPKSETPFKCYIYDTQATFDITLCPDLSTQSVQVADKGRGKVIGEFVCDRVDKIRIIPEFKEIGYDLSDDQITETCLTREAMRTYGKQKLLYGWHISDLEIYDKPKELGEFYSISYQNKKCVCAGICESYPLCSKKANRRPLTRPPQSWCYVEG